MKILMILILCILTYIPSFAMSPFSLESIKSVNVKILDKDKILDEPSLKSFTQEVEQKLLSLGIRTSTKAFSNLIIKIQAIKTDTITVCHINLSLVENAQLFRSIPVDAIAIGYMKDDLFESDDTKQDISQSIKFLIDEFIEQYKEENPTLLK